MNNYYIQYTLYTYYISKLLKKKINKHLLHFGLN